MDDNKVEKLKSIGYKIHPSCGLCHWSNLDANGPSQFGACHRHTYKHRKHTSLMEPVSVHRNGYCPHFRVSAEVPDSLHGFIQFLEGRNG